MRFYNQQHSFYCGIDLHARTMHLCILDHAGNTVFDKNLPCRPESFLRAVPWLPSASQRVHQREQSTMPEP